MFFIINNMTLFCIKIQKIIFYPDFISLFKNSAASCYEAVFREVLFLLIVINYNK